MTIDDLCLHWRSRFQSNSVSLKWGCIRDCQFNMYFPASSLLRAFYFSLPNFECPSCLGKTKSLLRPERCSLIGLKVYHASFVLLFNCSAIWCNSGQWDMKYICIGMYRKCLIYLKKQSNKEILINMLTWMWCVELMLS